MKKEFYLQMLTQVHFLKFIELIREYGSTF